MNAAARDTRGLSRAVVWTGIALGTALAVLAMSHGAVLRIGGLPSWLGVALGGLIVWALIVLAAVTLAELTRRHHTAAVRYAFRQGRRGGAVAARGARRHGGRLTSAAASWAAGRWQRRDGFPEPPQAPAVPAPQPVRFPAGGTPWGAPDPEGAYGTGPWMLRVRRADGQPYHPGPFSTSVGTAAVWTADDLRRRLTAAAASPGIEVQVTPLRVSRVCAACGNPENGPRRGGGTWGPLVVHHDPGDGKDRLIHRAHFEDESSGYHGGPYEAAPAAETTGGSNMTSNNSSASRITPARRARGAAARTGATVPAAWNAVVARSADFEPESDGELLDWMGAEVAGVAAYAEALVDLYESLTEGTGLDPVAMAALHDVADAQAHASETMSGARRKFADHYDRPREFAAEGGLMPHDGRWVTGEGDA